MIEIIIYLESTEFLEMLNEPLFRDADRLSRCCAAICFASRTTVIATQSNDSSSEFQIVKLTNEIISLICS